MKVDSSYQFNASSGRKSQQEGLYCLLVLYYCEIPQRYILKFFVHANSINGLMKNIGMKFHFKTRENLV